MPGTAIDGATALPTTRVLGIDASSNHAAFVQLCDGQIERYRIVTQHKGVLALDPQNTIPMILPKESSKDNHAVDRWDWWNAHLPIILGSFQFDVAALEDYAMGAKQGAHQLGEIGGLVRRHLHHTSRRWRKYGPTQIKGFAAHHGKADKDQMLNAAHDRWSKDWRYLIPPKAKTHTDEAADAADAHSCAQLLWTEYRLRMGWMQLKDLPPEEIRVFNSVSEKSKTNLLDTDWIQR